MKKSKKQISLENRIAELKARNKTLVKCTSCEELYKINQLVQWEEDDGSKSPFMCSDCYEYIVERWDKEII